MDELWGYISHVLNVIIFFVIFAFVMGAWDSNKGGK